METAPTQGVANPQNFREPTTVSPVEDWPAILQETAIEVFSLMVGGIQLTGPPDGDPPVVAHVTGMVGIAGAARAIFSLRCSEKAATTIASHMLGLPQDEADTLKCDAVGEVCNIVAGYFKAKIGLGEKCMLSTPTVLIGRDYQVRPPANLKSHSRIPLLMENEALWLGLEVQT